MKFSSIILSSILANTYLVAGSPLNDMLNKFAKRAAIAEVESNPDYASVEAAGNYSTGIVTEGSSILVPISETAETIVSSFSVCDASTCYSDYTTTFTKTSTLYITLPDDETATGILASSTITGTATAAIESPAITSTDGSYVNGDNKKNQLVNPLAVTTTGADGTVTVTVTPDYCVDLASSLGLASSLALSGYVEKNVEITEFLTSTQTITVPITATIPITNSAGSTVTVFVTTSDVETIIYQTITQTITQTSYIPTSSSSSYIPTFETSFVTPNSSSVPESSSHVPYYLQYDISTSVGFNSSSPSTESSDVQAQKRDSFWNFLF
ncbi:hypothetical protein BVG19_g421 [[Candida] boidinii]|nr:hypothetical protein BVG19_g421 [[Candida] boidinii]OWB50214.1 hypothetical protein B5S27_g1762 [[Candida] boidinii]OWB66828.1 hypothetical protein B5S30_g2174 [[Candida] boidinii]OWB83511.1 hypothetical protein B5S33_g2142 [[Candida] boidinii]GMF97624.1 unnamed protein product [[Candida] boidinii]